MSKDSMMKQLIAGTGEEPVTRSSLRGQLHALGVEEGMTLLVHSSLSSLGWVCGGPVAVVQALLDCVGEEGTLMMPTHSGDLSEPSLWENPAVPESWWRAIRAEMPAYDPAYSSTFGMGAIVDCFRMFPGVIRSAHPQLSFAAIGQYANYLIGEHKLEQGLGEGSPLARLYELDGSVLLLGVGYDKNTSLHLSECRANYPSKQEIEYASPMMVEGHCRWVHYRDLAFDTDDFVQIGEQYEREGGFVRIGQLGKASGRLMSQKNLVDYATRWMGKNRQGSPSIEAEAASVGHI